MSQEKKYECESSDITQAIKYFLKLHEDFKLSTTGIYIFTFIRCTRHSFTLQHEIHNKMPGG